MLIKEADTMAAFRGTLDQAEILNKQCFINEKNNTIEFRMGLKYEIPLNRASSPANILGWVQHLTPKSWMTKELLGHFIWLVTSYHEIEIR